MNKTLITLTIVALIATLALPAFAWRGHSGYGRGAGQGCAYNNPTGSGPAGPGYGMRAAISELPAEKQDQATALYDAHRAKVEDSGQELRAKMLELEGLMTSSEPDKARIEALVQDITNLQANLLQERVNFRLQFKAETGIDLPAHGGFGRHGFQGRRHAGGYGPGQGMGQGYGQGYGRGTGPGCGYSW